MCLSWEEAPPSDCGPTLDHCASGLPRRNGLMAGTTAWCSRVSAIRPAYLGPQRLPSVNCHRRSKQSLPFLLMLRAIRDPRCGRSPSRRFTKRLARWVVASISDRRRRSETAATARSMFLGIQEDDMQQPGIRKSEFPLRTPRLRRSFLRSVALTLGALAFSWAWPRMG